MTARLHHYVPCWLQRRFLGSRHHFYYLDLKPDRLAKANTGYCRRRTLLRWGPKRCFAARDLYSAKFPGVPLDFVETQFFGPVDQIASQAWPYLAENKLAPDMHLYEGLLDFLSVLKIRTPKGLDWLRSFGEYAYSTSFASKEALLSLLLNIRQMHITTWSESMWEVVSSADSGVQFLLTDHPITAYNPSVFPGSPGCRYPLDPVIELLGTRTIVPLDGHRLLILSNQEYVEQPGRANALRVRTNPRAFGFAWFSPTHIVHGRELTREQALQVNFILKKRAGRRIAAAEEEFLYPERSLKSVKWDGFDNALMPERPTFIQGIWAEYSDGTEVATDAFGRPITDEARIREMEDFKRQIAKREA